MGYADARMLKRLVDGTIVFKPSGKSSCKVLFSDLNPFKSPRFDPPNASLSRSSYSTDPQR